MVHLLGHDALCSRLRAPMLVLGCSELAVSPVCASASTNPAAAGDHGDQAAGGSGDHTRTLDGPWPAAVKCVKRNIASLNSNKRNNAKMDASFASPTH